MRRQYLCCGNENSPMVNFAVEIKARTNNSHILCTTYVREQYAILRRQGQKHTITNTYVNLPELSVEWATRQYCFACHFYQTICSILLKQKNKLMTWSLTELTAKRYIVQDVKLTDKIKRSAKTTDKFILPVIVNHQKLLMEMRFEFKMWDRMYKYCLRCTLQHGSDIHQGKFRLFMLQFSEILTISFHRKFMVQL